MPLPTLAKENPTAKREIVVMLLGQSRVFFSMSRDRLLPALFSAVHPRFRTPWISTLTVGVFVAVLAASLPIDVLTEMVSIGTLLAFVIVCAGVWIIRHRRAGAAVPNATGASGPNPGNLDFVGHDVEPDSSNLDPVGSLADHRDGDLFQLRPPSQPRAARRRSLAN